MGGPIVLRARIAVECPREPRHAGSGIRIGVRQIAAHDGTRVARIDARGQWRQSYARRTHSRNLSPNDAQQDSRIRPSATEVRMSFEVIDTPGAAFLERYLDLATFRQTLVAANVAN